MSTLKVGTIQDHANSITAITIDSAGRVNQPAKPTFMATTGATGSASYFSANATAVFPSADVNIGNCYNASNGEFTAPIAGTYYFSSNMLSNVNTRLFFHLRKNNVTITGTLIETLSNSGEYQTGSTDCTVTLAANDKVTVFVANNPCYGSQYANFKGFLLG